ncbi:hypothetical protein BJ508DRAFT_419061 [Ascobolus immersus RN42]|uniref:Uncharacterized protein n=1 Tax=Ascobolus immersus RN42 TaxID=1160509 RepID=A0A3N4HHB5_ASCIM|nr:hypothetical protein BJ508DRAFT_419061 [Ascobolus immersus RN42]
MGKLRHLLAITGPQVKQHDDCDKQLTRRTRQSREETREEDLKKKIKRLVYRILRRTRTPAPSFQYSEVKIATAFATGPIPSAFTLHQLALQADDQQVATVELPLPAHADSVDARERLANYLLQLQLNLLGSGRKGRSRSCPCAAKAQAALTLLCDFGSALLANRAIDSDLSFQDEQGAYRFFSNAFQQSPSVGKIRHSDLKEVEIAYLILLIELTMCVQKLKDIVESILQSSISRHVLEVFERHMEPSQPTYRILLMPVDPDNGTPGCVDIYESQVPTFYIMYRRGLPIDLLIMKPGAEKVLLRNYFNNFPEFDSESIQTFYTARSTFSFNISDTPPSRRTSRSTTFIYNAALKSKGKKSWGTSWLNRLSIPRLGNLHFPEWGTWMKRERIIQTNYSGQQARGRAFQVNGNFNAPIENFHGRVNLHCDITVNCEGSGACTKQLIYNNSTRYHGRSRTRVRFLTGRRDKLRVKGSEPRITEVG